MIAVDSSALVAIVNDEPGCDRLIAVMSADPDVRISAASLVEAGIVCESRRGPAAGAELDALIAALDIEVVPVDGAHAAMARQAFRLYGKGRHPAGLNFGDCFAYATSRLLRAPLLFVGQGFSKTDVVAA